MTKSQVTDKRAQLLVENIAEMFEQTTKLQMLPYKLVQRLNLAPWRHFERASDEMLRLASEFATEFLEQAKHDNSRPSIIRDLIKLERLTYEEISRSIVDLLIAAADTTSSSVQWLLYLLARHPEAQRRLHDEVAPLLGERAKLEWDTFRQATPYLSASIREAQRLFPVAPFLARTLDHEIVLDGYRIPAGLPIIFSLYTTSRMSKYFDEPLKFWPERWIRDKTGVWSSSKKIKSRAHATLPFGVGSRMCIGRRMAETEMSLLVAAIVQKFHIEPAEDLAKVKIRLKMLLSPDRPINLKLIKRQ